MLKLAALHLLFFYILFLTLLTPTQALVERGIAWVDNHDDALAAGLKAKGAKVEDDEWHRRANGAGVIKVRAEKVAEAAQVEERGDMRATSDGPDDSHDWLVKVKREEAVDKPAKSHDWLIKRSTIGPFHKSKSFPPSGKNLNLDKRGFIEEWMHPRGMAKRQVEVCKDPGWVPCANNAGCCPTLASCCPTICKADPSGVCCNGYSCKAGYQCKFSSLEIGRASCRERVF